MRAFLAVEPNNEMVLERIIKIQERLYYTGADLKFVAPKNIHFTIRFLGEIDDVHADGIRERLRVIDVNAVQVEYIGLGAFPSPEHINVVWVGTDKEGGERLQEIARIVDEGMTGLPFHRDKPFVPHLTISRVGSGKNRDKLKALIEDYSNFSFGRDTLTSLKLKKSVLTPKHPVYSDIHNFPFRGP